MADGVTIKLDGLKDLEKKLKVLGPRAAKAALRSGIRAAARVYIKEARRRLSGGYNTLRKSLNVRVHRPDRRGAQLRATVGPTVGRDVKYDAWYATIVEKGADGHDIRPRTAKVLVETSTGGRSGATSYGRVFGRRVKHPGVPARPFLGPAFASKTNEAIKVAGEKMWEVIEKRMEKGQ